MLANSRKSCHVGGYYHSRNSVRTSARVGCPLQSAQHNPQVPMTASTDAALTCLPLTLPAPLPRTAGPQISVSQVGNGAQQAQNPPTTTTTTTLSIRRWCIGRHGFHPAAVQTCWPSSAKLTRVKPRATSHSQASNAEYWRRNCHLNYMVPTVLRRLPHNPHHVPQSPTCTPPCRPAAVGKPS